MINQEKKYEMQYWNAKKELSAVKHRYETAVEVMRVNEFLDGFRWVADLGCGPFGGIFTVVRFDRMFAIDPLWKEYERRFDADVEGMIKVQGDSLNLNLPMKVDGIFTMNALDHSGDFQKSAEAIMDSLLPGGVFLMHVHMRTKAQLNEGHRMLITPELIEGSFSPMQQVWKNVLDECPFDKKAYRSYLGCWVNK